MAECIFEEKGDRMKKYAAFLRGINISGKNKIPMAELKSGLELLGYQEVSTYLQKSNCLVPKEWIYGNRAVS